MNACLPSLVAENLSKVRDSIGAAARRAGRRPEEVFLLPVTKNVPGDVIAALPGVGIEAVGESRVKEAQEKQAALGTSLEWQMVGQLQSNKARQAAALFGLMHSLDRLKLAMALSRAGEEAGKSCRCLIQVNAEQVPGRGGLEPAGVDDFIEKTCALPYLQICGLMALGPYPADEDAVRGAFRKVYGLFRRLAPQLGESFSVLSLGMSGDYGIAIEEGSTLVRIGNAIFGERR